MAFDNKLAWLAEFEFGSLFGYLIAVLFCLVLGYLVWDKYGKSKQAAPIEPENAAEEDLIQAAQTEPNEAEPQLNQESQLNKQPKQEGADVAHETQESQQSRLSEVPVQLDLLGFSTKQK